MSGGNHIDLTSLVSTGQQTNQVLTAILAALQGGIITSPGTFIVDASPLLNAATLTTGDTITTATMTATGVFGGAISAIPSILALSADFSINTGTIDLSGTITGHTFNNPTLAGSVINSGTIVGGALAGTIGADGATLTGTVDFSGVVDVADLIAATGSIGGAGTTAFAYANFATLEINGTAVGTGGGAIAAGTGVNIVGGSTINVDSQATVTVAGTATAVTPAAGTKSVVVQGVTSVGTTTVNVSSGYPGQELRLEIRQPATAETWNLGTTFSFGANITSFTVTPTANVRDLIQLINVGTTKWLVAALNQGFTI